MKTTWSILAIALAMALGATSPGESQGLQTGVLTGTVSSSDGLVLPGATVTVSSPALQGTRTTVTDVNGVYVLRGLPPGSYSIAIEMDGMAPVTDRADVPLGRTVTVDARMSVATVAETVTVAATVAPVVTNTTAGANYTSQEIQALPTARTLFGIAELAPGLTDNGTNAGQVTISGAFAYDNVFLVDGVDINDNLFGTANNLFIEDAISETQVLTSGISAEYGRFSGGVINVVTKRGGDEFSGSGRVNLANPAWTSETPFERSRGTERSDKLSQFYEGTFGGPLLQSRLWFFTAGRLEETTETRTFNQTGAAYDRTVDNKRYDVKGTGTIAQNHTVQVGYMNNDTTQINNPGLALSIDPRVLVTRQLPNTRFVSNYNGVLSPSLFGTLQYSRKTFGFRNTGGTSTAVADSPFRTRGTSGIPFNLHYNAPFFDSNDPEDRNNQQVAASLSWFASTARLGSHDVKGGVEWFQSTRTGGNSQSATGYVFQSDYLHQNGAITYDAQGRLVPVFTPGVSRMQQWLPTRGASIDIDTTSLYVHDRWTANRNLALDLGVRYERVRSEATGDIVGADTNTLVPRLGATYDLQANGRYVVQATYAHYAGKYSEAQFARNTAVGSPSLVTYGYTGPAGQGLDFAPGIDPANYSVILGGNFPTANVFFDEGLSSPVTREFTASLGTDFGRGYVKGTYVRRSVSDFIEDFITLDNGQTTVTRDGFTFGTFDNVVYRNTDGPSREYQAALFQGRFRVSPRWNVYGNWTVQLKNEGTFEGEAANQPGNPSFFGDYPEVYDYDRVVPHGRFDDYQRHKVRVWTTYLLDLGRAGSFDLSGLFRYNSALTYSLIANSVPLSAEQNALWQSLGYARAPGNGSQNLFFGERGSQEFAGYGLFDIGVTYTIPVWRSLRPWAKVEVLNVLDNDKLIAWDRSITANQNGPKDELGLPLEYTPGANFGLGTSNTHYPVWRPGFDGGRTFLAAFGVRF
jgi:hypothetical protein